MQLSILSKLSFATSNYSIDILYNNKELNQKKKTLQNKLTSYKDQLQYNQPASQSGSKPNPKNNKNNKKKITRKW